MNNELVKNGIEESNIQSGEKKKWQIALRRYVIEQNPSKTYAPFFGVDIQTFRKWIECQFKGPLSWETFGKNWQLEHIIPTSYFQNTTPDLMRCWNFTNIIVASEHIPNRPDILSAKTYFQKLYSLSGYAICNELYLKMENIEHQLHTESMISFIEKEKEAINAMKHFDEADFDRLNKGELLKELLFEKEILTKFAN